MASKITLLIEHDEEKREALRELLESTGQLQVETASDGRKGLERALALHPQAIVLNAALPELDGVTLLRRLDAEWSADTVVMYSPFISLPFLFEARSAGVDHFFPLPVAPETLLACVCGEGLTDGSTTRGRITKLLCSIGLTANLSGYLYIRDALILISQDASLLHAVTKELYPEIANQYHTNASCVERSMRHAVENLWSHGDIETLQQTFGAAVDPEHGKPTNATFLATLAEQLALTGQE